MYAFRTKRTFSKTWALSLFHTSTFPLPRPLPRSSSSSISIMAYSSTLPEVSITSNSPTIQRPKRRLSNAASVAAFDLSDQEDDEYNKPRSKRSRAGYNPRAGSPALSSFEGESAAGGGTTSPQHGGGGGVKALSEKEKESRRQARMIRNRSELSPLSPHVAPSEIYSPSRLPFNRCRSSLTRSQEGTHCLLGTTSS